MSSQRQELKAVLRMNDSIKYIRIQWTDYPGVLRARFIPVARCLEIASGSETIHLAHNSMIIPISTAPRTFSLTNYHEIWFLRPGWSSLPPCGFQAGHATVMSFVDHKDAHTRFDKCLRMLLFRTLKRLETE